LHGIYFAILTIAACLFVLSAAGKDDNGGRDHDQGPCADRGMVPLLDVLYDVWFRPILRQVTSKPSISVTYSHVILNLMLELLQ